MDTLPPLQRGKGIFVNLTLDGICRLHLSGGHAKVSLRIYKEAERWEDKDRSAVPKKAGNAMEKRQKTSLTMCLVAIGIVYGDIGTSPLYVMKSILEGNGGITQINEPFIVGALSLIIWTITLLTTIKYVLIAMKADNHGEGGIFSLYSLVRSCGKWLIVPAMLGGAALRADGVLTPAVTVTSAVEGLRSIAMMDRLLGGRQTGVIITLCVIASSSWQGLECVLSERGLKWKPRSRMRRGVRAVSDTVEICRESRPSGGEIPCVFSGSSSRLSNTGGSVSGAGERGSSSRPSER